MRVRRWAVRGRAGVRVGVRYDGGRLVVGRMLWQLWGLRQLVGMGFVAAAGWDGVCCGSWLGWGVLRQLVGMGFVASAGWDGVCCGSWLGWGLLRQLVGMGFVQQLVGMGFVAAAGWDPPAAPPPLPAPPRTAASASLLQRPTDLRARAPAKSGKCGDWRRGACFPLLSFKLAFSGG